MGQFAIGDRLAIRDLKQRDPNRMLELGALDVQRWGPTRRLTGEIRVQPRPCTLEHAHRSGIPRVLGVQGAAPGYGIAASIFSHVTAGAASACGSACTAAFTASSNTPRSMSKEAHRLKRGAVMRLVGKPQTREPTRVGGKRDVAQRRVVGGGYHAVPLTAQSIHCTAAARSPCLARWDIYGTQCGFASLHKTPLRYISQRSPFRTCSASTSLSRLHR